ncbi:MAG: cysteine dioxygenase, partial [Actinoplanes sp.]
MTAVDLRLDHLAIANHYAAAPEQWPVAPRFNPSERWYHRLALTDDHEVWLLTWLPGQGTELHDHGGSAGAFHV